MLGEFVAVKCDKYNEKPLISKIVTLRDDDITIEWYMGTFRGSWKPWKGKEDGQLVIYTDIIPKSKVLASVSFTGAMKLTSDCVTELKSMYKD